MGRHMQEGAHFTDMEVLYVWREEQRLMYTLAMYIGRSSPKFMHNAADPRQGRWHSTWHDACIFCSLFVPTIYVD